MWTKDELAALPNVVLGEISDACKVSLDCATVPIQNLTSLNVCLGKETGHRTIVKTPMIYRLINKLEVRFQNGKQIPYSRTILLAKAPQHLGQPCIATSKWRLCGF